MSTWATVARVDHFPPGTYQEVEVGSLSILIINQENTYYAIENLCTHNYVPLTGGHLEGHEFICPYHAAHFCIKTGMVISGPAYENISTFPVQIKDGSIQIEIS